MGPDSSADAVRIVESGAPTAELVRWSREASPVPEFAADELREYVEEMSGATLPTRRGTTADADGLDGDGPEPHADDRTDPVESLVAVVPEPVADEARSAAGSGIAVRDEWVRSAAESLAGTRPDSFSIRTVGDAVVLAGSTHRGTLYAAYELLERLGVRFFAPDFAFYEGDAEHVPERDALSVEPVETVEEPSFAYRRKDVAEGRSHTSRTICLLVDWMAKNKQNVLTAPADFTNLESGTVAWDEWRDEIVPELEKRGLELEVGGHGFDAFLPRAEYEDAHPEWFVDGCDVFDVTETAAVDAYVDSVVTYLERRPEIDVFDAWPPDYGNWPDRVVDEFGSAENAYAHVVGRLRDAIGERLDREVTIEALAYERHYGPPDPEYAYPGDVVVDFAVYDRSYEEPLFGSDSGTNAEYADLVAEWRESFDGTLCVHEYYRKYSWHSLPVALPALIGREMPAYDAAGFDGIWIYSEPADWIPYELTHLLVAAPAWDANRDADAYVEDYLADRYGDGAADVKSYLEHVETAGRTLFTSAGGAFDDPERVSQALAAYRRAGEALCGARGAAEVDSAAGFLLDRLATNAEFAAADATIAHHASGGDEAEFERAKERMRESIEDHCFKGVVLKSEWALNRCAADDEFPDPVALIQEYRAEWGG